MSVDLKGIANKVFRDQRKADMWLAEKDPFMKNKTPQEYLKQHPEQYDFVMLEMYMATLRDEYRPRNETYQQRLERITGLANHFFEDKKRAKEWLHSEKIPYMEYHKPVDLLKGKQGTRRVEQAFANMVYGFCA